VAGSEDDSGAVIKLDRREQRASEERLTYFALVGVLLSRPDRQPLTGSRTLICSRAAAADPVAIGPVAAGLAAVIGCSGAGRAVVIRRRSGDRCCG
jgi:hypothetical protein